MKEADEEALRQAAARIAALVRRCSSLAAAARLERARLRRQLETQERRVAELRAELDRIHGSRWWRVGAAYWALRRAGDARLAALRRFRPSRAKGAPPTLPDDIRSVRAVHVGGYWRGPNDMVRHMMLGLRAAGAQVLEVDTDEHPELLDTEGRVYDRGTTGPVWIRLDRLRRLVGNLRPNLVVCNAGGLGIRSGDAFRLRPRPFLLGIALSDPDVFEPATRHLAPHLDAFLTNAPQCLPRYHALGVRAGTLRIATNEEFFHPLPPRPQMSCQVLVLGRAHLDRVEPVRALVARFATHVYGEGWGEHGIESRGLIFGDDVLAALNSAATTVVFFRTAGGHSLVKVGLFDFAAAGALVVTNRSPEVAPLLAYGREIAGFDSTEELLAVIDHLLRHPEEARRMREAGRARVLREHTWRTVWPRILDDVRALAKAP